MHKLNSKQRLKLGQFLSVTGVDEKSAINIMNVAHWDVERGVDIYFESMSDNPSQFQSQNSHSSTNKQQLKQIFKVSFNSKSS